MKRYIYIIEAMIVLLLVSGCSLYRAIVPDPGPMPASFMESSDQGAAGLTIGRWWEQFNDPVLDSLMAAALADNLDAAQAFARLEQLAAVYKSVDSARSPYFNASGEARRAMQFSSLGESLGNTGSLSLAAGFELDLWQKLKSQSEAARYKTLASKEAVKSIYLSLTTQLADLYFLAVEQRIQLDLVDEIIKSYADTLALIEERYQEGVVPVQDLYQARQNLAAVQSRRPVIEASLARAEHAMAVLMGRFPEQNLAGKVAVLPAAPEEFAAGLPADLLARRPDIRAAHLGVQAKDAEVAAAIADRFPSFNLMAGYGRSIIDYGTASSGSFWSLLANIAGPIIDGGRRRAVLEQSRAALREEVAAYRQTVLQAFQEVEDALVNNRTSEERLDLLRQQRELAAAKLQTATDSYYQGLSDYLSVQIAQRTKVEIRSQLVSVERQLISDRISLTRALGGDWLNELVRQRLEKEKYKEQQQRNLLDFLQLRLER